MAEVKMRSSQTFKRSLIESELTSRLVIKIASSRSLILLCSWRMIGAFLGAALV
jgi:hypothetical protein